MPDNTPPDGNTGLMLLKNPYEVGQVVLLPATVVRRLRGKKTGMFTTEPDRYTLSITLGGPKPVNRTVSEAVLRRNPGLIEPLIGTMLGSAAWSELSELLDGGGGKDGKRKRARMRRSNPDNAAPPVLAGLPHDPATCPDCKPASTALIPTGPVHNPATCTQCHKKTAERRRERSVALRQQSQRTPERSAPPRRRHRRRHVQRNPDGGGLLLLGLAALTAGGVLGHYGLLPTPVQSALNGVAPQVFPLRQPGAPGLWQTLTGWFPSIGGGVVTVPNKQSLDQNDLSNMLRQAGFTSAEDAAHAMSLIMPALSDKLSPQWKRGFQEQLARGEEASGMRTELDGPVQFSPPWTPIDQRTLRVYAAIVASGKPIAWEGW